MRFTTVTLFLATHFIALTEVIRQGVIVGEEFGLFTMTESQERAFFQFISGVLAIFAAKMTMPKHRADDIRAEADAKVDQRVVDIMSSPAEIKQTATEAVNRAEDRADRLSN